MNACASTRADDALACRCLLDGNRCGDVIHRWLAADERAAKLSPAFRAYYMLRSAIPLSLRQLMQRSRRVETSERWCYPDAFLDALAEEIAALDEGITTVHPWPDGHDFAFVLTHDVETAEGMRNVMRIADLEEELGFRSSWNIVPYKYPVDLGLVRELTSRGFEVGVHGYNHDGKLFTSRRVFDARVPAINAALESFGAVGFRRRWCIAISSGCSRSTSNTMLPISTPIPTRRCRAVSAASGRSLRGGSSSCLTRCRKITLCLSPSRSATGEFGVRKWPTCELCAAWRLVITHPDYLDSLERTEIYRRFLIEAREMEGGWQALPRDVATWWRERDGLDAQPRDRRVGACAKSCPAHRGS